MKNEIRICQHFNCFNEITHMRKNAKYCCKKCKDKARKFRSYWNFLEKSKREEK